MTATVPCAAGTATRPRLKRRPVLFCLAAGALGALAACSKEPASPPATAPTDPHAAFDTASRGTGFDVGSASSARVVRVFFDPQCPHCAALWRASKPLLDRLRMVWMPVAFINPSSAPQGALILGAADPAEAMDRHESLLAGGQKGLAVMAPIDARLGDAIAANTALWRGLQAQAVPWLAWRAGVDGPFGVHEGERSTAELAQMLGL